jgi:anti-sigma factor RsiW
VTDSCREILGRLGPYAAEELPAAERRMVREHLASCGDCRREALPADPTLLFAGPVPIEDVSAADAARILEGVRAAVSVRRAERRLASG